VAQAAAEERWDLALRALAELLRRSPDAIPRHQKRVEVAYRSGDRLQLVGAYLSLAQALERAGALENARMVYERVLEHDAANPVAEAAVTALTTVVEPAPPVPEAVAGRRPTSTSGAILSRSGRDTRMRRSGTESGTSTRDPEFGGSPQTSTPTRASLRPASRSEMWIARWALFGVRWAPGGSEELGALGISFRKADAIAGSHRRSICPGEDEKIGLVYWLGRTFQEQGRTTDALRCYERALAVDITFLDLTDRVQRLTAERLP
jgi:tetratricopeptide (TPR) repeat protein